MIIRILRYLWNQLENVLTLLVAVVSSVLGFFGLVSLPTLGGLILALLALVAFAQMRDRSVRNKLSNRLDQLQENVVLDSFFRRDTDEKPLLERAREEIWLVRQTGSFIFDTDVRLIEQFLRRSEGGYIRVVLTAPTRPMLNQIALRNNLEIGRIESLFKLSQIHVESLAAQIAPMTKRLQVRFTPYPIQMNSVFIDPHHSEEDQKRAVVRYISFNENVNDLRDMLDFTLRGDLGPVAFSYYFEEARKIFWRSSKVVVLTGRSQSGKTRMIQGLIEDLSEADRDKLFLVLSSGNTSSGFEVTINKEPPQTFVEHQNGKDEVKLDVLKAVAKRLSEASGKLLIVDGIRSHHLECDEFIQTIKHLVDDITVTLFLTITLEEKTRPFAHEIEHHYRTTALNEEPGSKEQRLRQELEASLLLVEHAPVVEHTPDWGILSDLLR